MNNILFKETQYMTGAGILAGIILLVVFAVIYLFRAQGRAARALSVVVLIVAVCILAILSTLRLKTVYYPQRIEYQFVSIFSAPYEAVNLDSVTDARIITYNPSDYGGWGIRSSGNTRVYNSSGNKGLMLTFASGSKLLIGTQQTAQVGAWLKKINNTK